MPVLVSTHPGPVLFPSTGQPLSAVELRYLLYSSQLPLLAVQGREPKQRQFSGITRQDSISKCVAQFLEVIIRLSRQTSRWRQHCDLLRNARVIDLVRQCSPSDGSGRNYGIGSGFLASYLYHWKLRSELLETVIYVRINWRFFDLTAKLRCCCFRICTFQYFLLFDMITAIYLLGRCVR